MAYMVSFKSGHTDIIVNMESVTYISGSSDKYCTIHFAGTDQSVNVDASAFAVIGLAQNGTMLPSKKA